MNGDGNAKFVQSLRVGCGQFFELPPVFGAAFIFLEDVRRARKGVDGAFAFCADDGCVAADGDRASKVGAHRRVGCGQFFDLSPSVCPALVLLKKIGRSGEGRATGGAPRADESRAIA